MPPTAAVGQPARSVCLQSPGAHAALLRLSNVAVVRALRAAGPDVTTAADLVGGADDTVVAGLAAATTLQTMRGWEVAGQRGTATIGRDRSARFGHAARLYDLHHGRDHAVPASS